MQWQKGQSGNPSGKAKGTRNHATTEIRTFARSVFENPQYRANLKKRLIEGTAGPMEPLILYYGFGRPVNRIAQTDPTGEQAACSPEPLFQTDEEKIAFLDTLREHLKKKEAERRDAFTTPGRVTPPH